VTKFRDRMVELNRQIDWVPAHIRDGLFGNWLAGARDWSISRNRFWGTPIPVWRSKSGKIKVFGSIAELEAASGKKVKDLHRPFIDEIVITEGGEEYRRVEDVFDCWFESGSMPYAQVHYPFDHKDWFETHFPADFIVEYVAQTRGWFYTLMVLSTALFGKPPFLNCICHGVVLDDKGQKLSKRLNNYADPKWMFDTFGADALRWFMLNSPVMRGAELYIDKEGKFIRDVVRLAIKPIWNAYNFFTLYANADGVQANYNTGSSNIMDRYILAKCREAVAAVKHALDVYDTPSATEAVTRFFEALNNWYIRRNKERFWKAERDADKQAAYDTLYTALHAMCRAAAPLLPMTLEVIYRGLTGEKSVHLADFPRLHVAKEEAAREDELIKQMDFVRDICNAALAIRNKANIRVRQPLQSCEIVAETDRLREFQAWETHDAANFAILNGIVRDEINVRQFTRKPGAIHDVASLRLQINSAALGKRLPAKMKQILPASKKGDWMRLPDGRVEIAGEVLETGEFTILLEPKPEYKDRAAPLSTNDALVILDTAVTPELEREGLARDLVRMIQQARKDAGLHVTDRIRVGLDAPGDVQQALAAHRDYIAEQTLATDLAAQAFDAPHRFVNELEGKKLTITLAKAA
jgi:isoleucyl-tRNA synthetase